MSPGAPLDGRVDVPAGCPYDVAPLDGHPDRLPLVVRPRQDRNPAELCKWIQANKPWLLQQMQCWGAVLFRGFDIRDAAAFEQLAHTVDPDLKNEYLGTSPRNALTPYTFTASELPSFYPIPQHCEMSFTRTPPRKLFFCCLTEPAEGSGETPLADFRLVLRDLDPAVAERFRKGGIRIVRNYAGASSSGFLNPFQLKRWDEIFLTTDREAVEAKCREEGFEPQWKGKDGLRLVSTQDAVPLTTLEKATVSRNICSGAPLSRNE